MATGKTVVYRFSEHGNLQKPLLQLPDGRLVRMRGPDYVFYEFHDLETGKITIVKDCDRAKIKGFNLRLSEK